ncbi:MAG TPA: aldehyde dehydrogenase family protein [Blastocatellia bacterium]|jgi:succinate-semialdehyde dehydrogenase/glutarate-semialdehyde dehydrogenase|nr:aldehyde dehydrogenase family protein [Blastocatellia bacterium]
MAQMLIGGEWVGSRNGAMIEVLNPATGEAVDTVPRGTVEDAREAIDAAEAAFAIWSEWSQAKRADVLRRTVALIRAREKELATLLTREQGKPVREAVLEIRRYAHTIEYYAGLGKNIRGGYIPQIDDGKYGLIIKRPLGVCGAIVPWNFPVSLMGNKIGPALLAGNTMVVKPAETTPLTDLKVIGLFEEAGLPKGVLNMVTGQGSVVGEEIVSNPKVRKIGFTGSTEIGRRVMATAAKTIKRVTLELGGSDPMIVCDDADLDAASKAAAVGRFFNCGQACLAIKRLYLFDSIADEFIERLVARVKKLRVGNGLSEGTVIGPMHSESQRDEVESQVQDALDRGARALTGGGKLHGEDYDNGHFYAPTLLVDVPEDARVATEEVFGPALPIFRVGDLNEAIEKANDSIFGLGSSVWTNDLNRATRAAERIEAGYTWINSPQTIYDELPFGGFKQSGLGKEHGIEALDYYSETKAVVVSTSLESARKTDPRGE